MLIIAHRANGFGFPENSVAAACACLDAGFVPEIDLRAAGNGRPPWSEDSAVLSHDPPAGGEPNLRDLVSALRSPLRRHRTAVVLAHLKDAQVRPALTSRRWLMFVSFSRTGAGGLFTEVDTPGQLRQAVGGAVVADNEEWLDTDMVREAHERNVAVLVAGGNVFRPNHRRWAALYRMGADGILTDAPKQLAAFLEDIR